MFFMPLLSFTLCVCVFFLSNLMLSQISPFLKKENLLALLFQHVNIIFPWVLLFLVLVLNGLILLRSVISKS